MNTIALSRPLTETAPVANAAPATNYFAEEEERIVHPALRRFDFLWRSHAQDGALPGRRHFDPAHIQDLMPYLMLIDVIEEEGVRRFRTRMAGHHHVSVIGDNPAGRFIDDGHDAIDLGYASSEVLHDVVDAAEPLYLHHRVQFAPDRHLDAEGAIYPLSENGERIERLIAVIAPHYPKQTFLQRLRNWL